jgi:hypothetical protein
MNFAGALPPLRMTRLFGVVARSARAQLQCGYRPGCMVRPVTLSHPRKELPAWLNTQQPLIPFARLGHRAGQRPTPRPCPFGTSHLLRTMIGLEPDLKRARYVG